MAKIFWVEDQFHWIDKFKPVLEGSDLDHKLNEVEVYKFVEAAKQRIARMNKDDGPDIAILDANMNGRDQAGFSVSTALRDKWPALPIIFLSEYNGTGIERDALENYGVLDFISKHQKNAEDVLCWRIRAVLRQAALKGNVAQSVSDSVISSGGLKIDLDTWEVYWHDVKLTNPDNSKRPLPPMPRKILRCLVERSPRPVSTDQVAEFLELDIFSDATYRQHIKTLRRSLDMAEGGDGSFIEKCKQGCGIVTHGEANAYLWKPCRDNS
jgi:two-component system OmpR family response regulator